MSEEVFTVMRLEWKLMEIFHDVEVGGAVYGTGASVAVFSGVDDKNKSI